MKRIILPIILAALTSAAFAQVPEQINYQGRVSVQGINFTGTGNFKFALLGAAVNSSQTATATAVVQGQGDGLGLRVVSISVDNPGSNYADPPTVTIISGSGGTGATAHAQLDGAGHISAIIVDLDGVGGGYGNLDTTIEISAPPENLVSFTTWSNDGTSNFGSEPAAAVSLNVASGLYSVRLGDTTLPNMIQPIFVGVANTSPLKLRVWFDDGTHGFQLLTPDQPLASVPWAMKAANADSANTVPDGAITAEKLADGAVASSKLAAGSVSSSKLATGAVGVDRLNITGTPGAGKVLAYGIGNNLTWATATGGGGGLSLPFNNSYSDPGSVLGLSNDNGDGLYGQTGAINKSGVVGINDVLTTIFNQSPGQGVFGYSSGIGAGVLGVSEKRDGISGRTNGIGRTGVFGYAEKADSSGVHGASTLHHGVYAYTGSTNRAAIWAQAPNGGDAVYAHSGLGDGVVGFTNGAGKSGVFGWTNRVDSNGVTAINASGTGLFAKTDSASATAGFFWNTAGGDAIRTTGNAVVGGDVIANGAGNQQAYMGGNNDGDVEFGSKNATVTVAAFYNQASGKFLNILARDATVRQLTITGGADLAEPFAMSHEDVEPGSVVVIDSLNPGKLRKSQEAYDKKVAGIVSGADGIRPGISMIQEDMLEAGKNVALSGRVYVKANTSAGEIQPGDLLTTSAIPGEAMKAADHGQAQGAILGKAMTSLSGDSGKVLVLVTLQ